jgi:hypothetical protein
MKTDNTEIEVGQKMYACVEAGTTLNLLLEDLSCGHVELYRNPEDAVESESILEVGRNLLNPEVVEMEITKILIPHVETRISFTDK